MKERENITEDWGEMKNSSEKREIKLNNNQFGQSRRELLNLNTIRRICTVQF